MVPSLQGQGPSGSRNTDSLCPGGLAEMLRGCRRKGLWSSEVMLSACCKDNVAQRQCHAPRTRVGLWCALGTSCWPLKSTSPPTSPQKGDDNQRQGTPRSPCHGLHSSPASLAANSSFWKIKSGAGKTASYPTATAPKEFIQVPQYLTEGHQSFQKR